MIQLFQAELHRSRPNTAVCYRGDRRWEEEEPARAGIETLDSRDFAVVELRSSKVCSKRPKPTP